MSIDLTQIMEAVITLAAALIARYVVPWIRQRLTVGGQEILDAALRVAVMSAEQMYRGRGRGREKLEAAKTYMETKGFTVDVEQIEAAVWSNINCDKVEME